jgi:hypothetical protein
MELQCSSLTKEMSSRDALAAYTIDGNRDVLSMTIAAVRSMMMYLTIVSRLC